MNDIIDLNSARDFLLWLHPDGPWSVGAVDPDNDEGLAWHTSSNMTEVLDFLARQAELHRNLYYQGNLCRPDLVDRRANKASVVVGTIIHADIDPPAFEGSPEEAAALLTQWQTQAGTLLGGSDLWAEQKLPVPSAIVFSGSGFQPIWKLEQPLVLWQQTVDSNGAPTWEQDPTSIEAIEGRNIAMLRRLDPGHGGTHNIDRLLRIPGSYNWPNDVKRKKYGRVDPVMSFAVMTDVRVALDALPFESSPQNNKPKTSVMVLAGDPVTRDRLKTLVPAWLYIDIVDGPGPTGDRSKAGFAATCSMIKCGLDDETIASILGDIDFKISGHYLDNNNPERAISRAIAYAHEEVDPDMAESAEFMAAATRWAGETKKQEVALAVLEHASAPAPSTLELEAAMRAAERKLSRRSDGESIADAERLKRLRTDKFLTHDESEDPRHALAKATLAVARVAPPGTTPAQIERVMLGAAGGHAHELVGLATEALQQARALPPLVEDKPERKPKFEQAVASDEFEIDVSGSNAGRPAPASQHNFDVATARLGVTFRYDEFARRKLIGRFGREEFVEDSHVRGLMFEIESTFKFYPPKDKFYDYVADVAQRCSFHPVKNYIASCGQWDGVDRTSSWLIDFGGAEDTPYVRAISRLVLVAAVRRIRQPGCKFDEMLILEGSQGSQKSTALSTLCPDRAWFTDDFSVGMNTQMQMERTAGKWIVEAGELKGMSAGDQLALKGNMSRQVDEARAAYGREVARAPRQYVLIGTTNDAQYLKDMTGDRRYWPVAIRGFDIPGLRAARDQIWAEAAYLDLAFPEESYIRLPPTLYQAAAIEQEKRKVDDSYQIMLENVLGDANGRVKVQDLWKPLFGEKLPSPTEQGKMSSALLAMGFRRVKITELGTRTWWYVRGVEVGSEHLSNNIKITLVQGTTYRAIVEPHNVHSAAN